MIKSPSIKGFLIFENKILQEQFLFQKIENAFIAHHICSGASIPKSARPFFSTVFTEKTI